MGKRDKSRKQKLRQGFVWIVGAGPGDPRLLTLKAKECLERADVVVYDRLVTPAILSFARPDAELIYAGKTPNGEKTSQDWINEVLIAKAREGKKVVRLKNGDPFVFGRGAEEAEALADAGIPFEIVPGISSVFAVPAYAGIPLTDRRFASQFAVGTGKSAEGIGGKPEVDFQQLAKANTIVALMAVGELERVVAQLIEGGKSPQTHAALIEWGTTSHQKVVVSELGNLPDVAIKQNVKPPAVLVVGEVVKLREKLAWYETKPLFGKRILFPCTEETKAMASDLEDLGAEVVRFPIAKAIPSRHKTRLKRGFSKVLTSICLERTKLNGSNMRTLASVKFASDGREEKDTLSEQSVYLDFSQTNGNGHKREHHCTIVPNRLPSAYLDAVLKDPFHIIIFTSASLAEAFFDVLGHEWASKVLEDAEVWVIGPRTEQICRQKGVKPSAIVRAHTFDGLLKSLVKRGKE